MTQERAGLKSLSANYRYIGTILARDVYYDDQHLYECLNCKTRYCARPNKYCSECGVRFRGDPKSFRPAGIPRWAWPKFSNSDELNEFIESRKHPKPDEKVWVIRRYDWDCPEDPPKVHECHAVDREKPDEDEVPRKYSDRMVIMKNLLRRLAELRAEEHRGNSIPNSFCRWEVVHNKYDVVLAVPPDSVTKSVFGPGVHNYLCNRWTDEEMEERKRSLED